MAHEKVTVEGPTHSQHYFYFSLLNACSCKTKNTFDERDRYVHTWRCLRVYLQPTEGSSRAQSAYVSWCASGPRGRCAAACGQAKRPLPPCHENKERRRCFLGIKGSRKYRNAQNAHFVWGGVSLHPGKTCSRSAHLSVDPFQDCSPALRTNQSNYCTV